MRALPVGDAEVNGRCPTRRFTIRITIDDDGIMPLPFRPMWASVRRRVRGGAELRWLTARSWTPRWYPQGIDTGRLRGRRMLAVSWFRQDARRRHLASRISLVDLGSPRRAVDVALAIRNDDGSIEPARIHTGGIAWDGDRLFAAATMQGIWEFDLSAIRRVEGAVARRVTGASESAPTDGSRPKQALVATRARVHPIPLRCSFLSRVLDEEGRPLPRVLIGEFREDTDGRIGEFALGDDGFTLIRTFVPGIPRMQGAVLRGARVLVSQSDGTRPGVLWDGTFDGLTRSAEALLAGCQDLALDEEAGVLWTLGEHPWHRVVRGIPYRRLGIPLTAGERRLDG